MAAKQPAVGIDHLTVVPTNSPPMDKEREAADGNADADDADAESHHE